MGKITAQMVKELRDKTGVGMMDCKRALVQAEGDLDLAIEHLRKSGIAKATKKAGRAATEGKVLIAIDGGVAGAVEVLCETDFAAGNERFLEFGRRTADGILRGYEQDGDLSGPLRAASQDMVGDVVGVIGENIQLGRAVRWTTEDGCFGSYLHMGGRIGVLVEAVGDTTPELISDICMHVAAFSPQYVSPEDIPPDVVAKEKEIARAQVQGKPENIIDKIVMGKVAKWYTETCLIRQPWIRDDKKSLAKIASGVTVRRFLRWQVGEGA